MLRRFALYGFNTSARQSPWAMVVCLLLFVLVGCGPSPQDVYDRALKQVDREQVRLDSLRPAYDAARQKAMLAVTKELAGTTRDETAQNALKQLEGIAGSAGRTDLTSGTNQDQIDAAINHLTTMQTAIETQSGLLGAVAKTNETLQKIETPGTPESKRFEEVLASMPEVQAYQRQEKRLADATKAALEAEAKLPDGAKKE